MEKKRKFYKLLRTIIYFIFIMIVISPVFIMISTSLKTYSEVTLWPPRFFGENIQLVNYKDVLFGKKNILRPLTNSLIISSITALLSMVFGMLAAYGASRYEFKFKKTFLILIIITQMFASVILVSPMYMIFQCLGILNTKLALIIANTSTSLPMAVWLLYSYLNNIPKDLEEAAWMDGCSRLQGIRYILSPLLLPGLITTGLFAFIVSWGDILFSSAFTLSPDMRTISLALTDFQSVYQTAWEKQMAASVISVIPTFIIFVIIQKHLIKGLTSSGVKG